MKQSEIKVGVIYLGRHLAAHGWRPRRRPDRIESGIVYWEALAGPGAPYGECSLATFARWAVRRSVPRP